MNPSLPCRPRPPTAPVTGFTLIELMITVSIVAILAAIAYPSYRNYVLRGQLVDATNGLSAVQANMERYFQDNRTYIAANTFTPPCSTPTTYGTFTVSCPLPLTNPPSTLIPPTPTNPTPTAFQLQAVGTGPTAGFAFFIDQLGNKASTVTAPAPSGWTTCTIDWETKAGQCS